MYGILKELILFFFFFNGNEPESKGVNSISPWFMLSAMAGVVSLTPLSDAFAPGSVSH